MQDMSEKSLVRMFDRDAIQDCMTRYCRGIDRRDRQLLEDVYWPGAVDDHGNFKGDAAGFVDWVLPLLDSIELTQHSIGQSMITLDGNSAAVETCFTAYHRMTIEGVLCEVFFGGRYVDRFEKRGQEWRIGYRLMIGDWHRSSPAPADYWQVFALGALPAANAGLGGTADPSTKLFAGHWPPVSVAR